MAIENRQEQGFYATATREDMRGVWRAEGIDERSDFELRTTPSAKASGPPDCFDEW